jgi:LacI family transcriptional regulator
MKEIHRKRKPTQLDVAHLADVSQATVSQILNPKSNLAISAETRERVASAVAKLGYVPNRAAQSLRSKRTFTIACLIPDVTNPFYPALERGILDVCDRFGYDLLTYNSDGKREKELKFLRLIQEGRADGVVGVFFHVNAKDLSKLLSVGTPIVRLEAIAKETSHLPLDNVYVNNVAAAEAATNYLVAKGYRRIAVISCETGPHFARLRGYRQALHTASLEETIMHADDFMEDGGYSAMRQLLELSPRPDAVFAVNDLLAIGALMATREAGLKVPRDVAIMGFDDIPLAKLISPALTTVEQPKKLLGIRAAELLLDRLNGSAAAVGRSEELPFKLVVRESA